MNDIVGPEGIYTHLHFQASFGPLSYNSLLKDSNSNSNPTNNPNSISTTAASTSTSTSNSASSSTSNTNTNTSNNATTATPAPNTSNSTPSSSTSPNNQSSISQPPTVIPQFTPRISSVSVRNPNPQSSNKKDPRDLTDSLVGASRWVGGGGGSQGKSTKSNNSSGRNQTSDHISLGNGPILESPMASQGIDTHSFSLTGGWNGIKASCLEALPFGSKSGLFPHLDSEGHLNNLSTFNSSRGAAGSNLNSYSSSSSNNDSVTKDEKKQSSSIPNPTPSSRPKNNLKSTSSSFIQRVQFHPDFSKLISTKSSSDSSYFLNVGKSFLWLNNLTSTPRDSLLRIVFNSSPTCHDVNQATRSITNLDVLIGFSSGDIIWLDPILGKYSRINKGSKKSEITQIRWLPGSECLFMSSHQDGTVVIWDREREEAKDGSWKLSQWTPKNSGQNSNLGESSKNQPMNANDVGNDESMEILDSKEDRQSGIKRPDMSRKETDGTIILSGGNSGSTLNQSSPTSTSRTTTNSDLKPLSNSISASTTDSSRDPKDAIWDPRHSIIVTHPGQVSTLASNQSQVYSSQFSSTNNTNSGNSFASNVTTPLGSSLPSDSSLGLSTNGNGVPSSPLARYQSLGNDPNDLILLGNSSSGTSGKGKGKETPWNKLNPVSHWRVARSRINDFAFSPDFQHVAIIGEDGILRIMDLATEKLLESFDSFFGAFTCLSWSPDGRFLLTGSQDDLVTLFAPREGRVVARCQGHTSFVTGVAFDPWRWSDRTYRFASVGEDLKLIFWDFSSASLGRTKQHGGSHHHHTTSGSSGRRSFALASTPSLIDKSVGSGRRSLGFNRPMPAEPLEDSELANHHQAPSRSEIPLLQPTLVHQIHFQVSGREKELLASVRFNPQGLNLVYRSGAIDSFARPSQNIDLGNGNGHGNSNLGEIQTDQETKNSKAINIPDSGSGRRRINQAGGFLGFGKGVAT